jgi:adenosine deaminase/adenosine deaminase CECR1
LISINYTFENGTPTFSYNKNMKLVYTLLVAFVLNTVYSQPTDAYFEKIRNNEAQLTAFFSQMPKEAITPPFLWIYLRRTIVKHAIAQDFYLNCETMDVKKTFSWKLALFSSLKAMEH